MGRLPMLLHPTRSFGSFAIHRGTPFALHLFRSAPPDPFADRKGTHLNETLDETSLPEPLATGRGGWRVAGVVGLIAIIFIADLITPGNIILPMLYMIPLLRCARFERPNSVWILAAVCVLLTFFDLVFGTPPQTARWYFPWINRGIASVSLLASAALAAGIIHARDALESANDALIAKARETELHRLNAVETADRKTRFLAAVSHDIRTPANAINLLAELLLQTTNGQAASHGNDDDQSEMIRDLRSNALSLTRLVGDVLDVTRFELSEAVLHQVDFRLSEFLQDEIRQHRPAADEKGIDIALEVPFDMELRTDRVKLGRVLSNLLGNAIKFTKDGNVTVTSSLIPAGGWRLSVRDTGIGIDPDNLPRIFDEFFQIKNPARDHTKGSGLGLAIARRLTEALGGKLTVESKVGMGSTFTVTLPANVIAGTTSDTLQACSPSAV